MRTRIKDRKLIEHRRVQIAQVALRIFVKKGFERTNVDKIAEACGMGVGSLYRYVGKKEDILYLAIEYALSQLDTMLENWQSELERIAPPEAVRKIIRDLFEVYDANQDSILFTYHETRNLGRGNRKRCFETEEYVVGEIERVLCRGCQAGEFQIDNTRIAAHNIIVLAEMWAVRRWFVRKEQTLEEHIRQQTEIILRGICGLKNEVGRANRKGELSDKAVDKHA